MRYQFDVKLVKCQGVGSMQENKYASMYIMNHNNQSSNAYSMIP